jgi:hypothetical protein
MPKAVLLCEWLRTKERKKKRREAIADQGDGIDVLYIQNVEAPCEIFL